jgi:hypothetical protein
MRVTITEPCIIESDGPLYIIPLVATAEVTITQVVPEPEPKPKVEMADHPAYRYPKERKPMARRNKVCINCGRTYRGTTQQLYCSGTCKHEFYDRDRKPRPETQRAEPIVISAGATGVRTSADQR